MKSRKVKIMAIMAAMIMAVTSVGSCNGIGQAIEKIDTLRFYNAENYETMSNTFIQELLFIDKEPISTAYNGLSDTVDGAYDYGTVKAVNIQTGELDNDVTLKVNIQKDLKTVTIDGTTLNYNVWATFTDVTDTTKEVISYGLLNINTETKEMRVTNIGFRALKDNKVVFAIMQQDESSEVHIEGDIDEAPFIVGFTADNIDTKMRQETIITYRTLAEMAKSKNTKSVDTTETVA